MNHGLMNNGIEITLEGDWHRGKTLFKGIEYTFTAKIFGLPSEWGIDGGVVSILEVRDSAGKRILLYDREWIEEPATDEVRAVLRIILSQFD
jgi:hypothetical protein